MTTEIKTWEIREGGLVPLETTLAEQGRTEALDLESWLESDPTIIGPGLKVIGRQVSTRSGPLDLLAVDASGDLVVIELKRDKLPREALAQAIDYASDVATWSLDKVGEVCAKHTGQGLEDAIGESFPEIDIESLSINASQRIVLVGFAVESALARMIEWLSEAYGVAINAVVLKYVRTSSGNEVLTRTSIISEEIAETRIKKKKFEIPMSDEPGSHDEEALRGLLVDYFTQGLITAERIRDVLIPACLAESPVTREGLKQAFIESGTVDDPKKVGYALAVVSGQMGMEKNDFLRQVVGYEYPNNPWEKDNYFVREEYRELLEGVVRELGGADE